MAKKGKGNKPTSARGHREESTLRWRLEQKLVRIGPKGRTPVPINTFSKDWLSNHLLQSDTLAPPMDHSKPPSISNVASFAEHKAKREKPVVKRQSPKTQPQGWLHNKALAMSEFRGWSRTTQEVGRSSVACELWTKEGSKLRSPSLDLQRELSKAGHLKEKAVINTPKYTEYKGKSKPLDPKFYMPPIVTGTAGLAPSGLPIRLFTEGKYKPKENAVVYTTPEFVGPPTPTRDWRLGAINDNRYDNAVSDWVQKTNAMVQWFLTHVEVQNWPTYVHNFVHWKKDGPIPNTGAINKAASHPETELILIRALHEGLEKDWYMLDKELEDNEQEIALLRQELATEKQQNRLMEYELAHYTGDKQSVAAIQQENTVGSAKTPEDADQMLTQYRMYKAFARVDGEATAFARFVWNDPKLGKVMEDQADLRFNERQSELYHRNFVRFLQDFASYQVVNQAEIARQQARKDLFKNGRRKSASVVDVGREAVSYAAMSRKAKPQTLRNSIYYSSLYEHQCRCPLALSTVNDLAAHAILSSIQGYIPDKHPNTVSKYVKWWENQLPRAEVNYAVTTQPVKTAVVKGYNKLMDTLNTEINPFERKRKKEWVKSFNHEQEEQRERRLEAKANAKRKKIERDQIRKAMRIAY